VKLPSKRNLLRPQARFCLPFNPAHEKAARSFERAAFGAEIAGAERSAPARSYVSRDLYRFVLAFALRAA